MPSPIALIVSLYDKQFLKNHNFRRHIAENGRDIGGLLGGVGGCYGSVRGCWVYCGAGRD